MTAAGAGDPAVPTPGIAGAGALPTDPQARRQARERLGWTANNLVVLTDGSRSPLGSLVAAARATARARRRGIDARLAILQAGRGPGRALLRLIGGNSVDFLDGAATGPAMRAADIFLQTREGDDGGLVLAALAAGLPVVLPLSDAFARHVTDGVQGLVVGHSRDTASVNWKLRSLAEPRLRGAMAAQARVLAAHHGR